MRPLLLVILVVAAGCMRTGTVPPSIATDEEQFLIDDTLRQISDLTTYFGERYRFDRLPVIVIDEDWQRTKRLAYCSLNPNYLAVNKIIFQYADVKSKLFFVLLHEIGHCYFRRPHDNSMITPFLCASAMCERAVPLNSTRKLYYVGEMIGKVAQGTITDLESLSQPQP
jgi:hypothetical protein